jgi:hypothetical protein
MAISQGRTDTVGDKARNALANLTSALRRAEARNLANGKWQVRKLRGKWCLISPRGELIMTGEAHYMREWAFRMVRLTADAGKPF